MRVVILTLIGLFLFSPAQAADLSSLTNAERAWLQDHPEPIRVHNEMAWAPYNFNEGGEPKGHSIDYIKLVASKLGLTIEFVSGPSWDEFLEMMRNGSLDLMLNIANTKDRREYLVFSEPYLLTWTSLYVRSPEYGIKDLEDLKGKKIAFVRGFFFSGFIQKYYPEIEIVTFDTSLKAFLAVDKGLADAAMEVPIVARESLLDPRLKNMKLGGKISDPNFIPTFNIAARKDNPVLLGIIQKGMDAVTLDEELALRQRWNLEESEQPFFSIDETAFIKKLGNLRACINPDRLPLEAINLDGSMSGISSEFVNLIGQKLKMPFGIIRTRNWVESLEYAEQGKCDLLPMVTRTVERERYLNFTAPWFSQPLVMATGPDQIYISNIDQVIGQTIGVVRGLATRDILLTSYPDIKLVEVESVSEGLEKVESGKLFGLIDTIPTISRTLQAEAITGVKISGDIGLKVDYAIGVPKDKRQLLDILDRSASAVDKNLISEIHNRWLAVAYIDRFDYTRLWQILFAVFLFVLYVIYRYRRGLQITAELKDAMREAEEANKVKSRFLAAASHDLRQPVHAISLFSTALQNRMETDENVKLISRVQSSLGSLANMLDGLLDMSRLENHAIIPQPHNFSVQTILDEIKSENEVAAEAKNLDFRVIGSSAILYSDQTLLSRIVGNFVTNAIRYTEKGRVLVGCRLQGDHIRIEVWDTGKGIAAHEVDHIFDPHRRLEGARTHAADGLGLGLSISEGFGKLLDHPLGVRSTAGVGSLFTVEVPIGTRTPELQSEDNNGQKYPDMFQGHTVLVVDDDETVLDGMKAVLTDWGCEVMVANNTASALQSARSLGESLDVVISDFHLPDNETGISLLKEINSELGRTVPAIIISGDTHPERRREIEAAGYFLLTKPVQPVSLRPLLRRQLRRKVTS